MSVGKVKRPTPEQAKWLHSFLGVDISDYPDHALEAEHQGSGQAGTKGEGSVSAAGAPGAPDDKTPPTIKVYLVANAAKDVKASPADDAAGPAPQTGSGSGADGPKQADAADDRQDGGQDDGQDETGGMLVQAAYRPGQQTAGGRAPGQHGHGASGSHPSGQTGGLHLPTSRADAALDTADKAIDVVDKLVTLGERVAKIMKDSKSLTVSPDSRVSVVPDGAKWQDLLGGQPSGDVRFAYELWRLGPLPPDVSIMMKVEWLSNLTYKGKGQYIKNATVTPLDVSILPGHDVTIEAEFTDPYQGPGGTKGNPIAMLPVRIKVTDVTFYLTVVKTYEGVIKGSGGFEKGSIS